MKSALEELSRMCCSELPHYQFLYAQLGLLLTAPKARRFDRNLYVLAADLHNISPAAYRMLRKSGAIALPRVELLKKLLSNSLHDENLRQLLQELQPQQRLVNILFDEVKLTETLRYSGGHVVGYAQNRSGDAEVLATHALVIEVVCYFGGPKYILRIHPVAKLNSDQLKGIILEALVAVSNAGGTTISCIYDNCNTNVSVDAKLGGAGRVFIDILNSHAFLVYDYVHLFKNIRNNWITVPHKELAFTKDGKSHIARWKDIEALYIEDRKNCIRLTKITYTAVYPKPLQRQSMPFVCQIFNDKTVAALSTLKYMLSISEGTIVFVKLITDWFHMMNVKDRFSGINTRDECGQPWTKNCTSFKKLDETCDVISSCTWPGGQGRTQKLTKQTAYAFVLSTRANVQATELLLTHHNFSYVLPGVIADEALEKFFGQARQRSAGNFYIDVVDIKAAAETKNLRALLKYNSTPQPHSDVPCTCSIHIEEDQFDITILETEDLVQSNDTIKHKIIFIAGYLERKFRTNISTAEAEDDDDNLTDSEILTNLNRSGLTVPYSQLFISFIQVTKCLLIAIYTAVELTSAKPYLVLTVQCLLFKEHVLLCQTYFWSPLCLIIVIKKDNLAVWEGRKNSHLKTKLQ